MYNYLNEKNQHINVGWVDGENYSAVYDQKHVYVFYDNQIVFEKTVSDTLAAEVMAEAYICQCLA